VVLFDYQFRFEFPARSEIEWFYLLLKTKTFLVYVMLIRSLCLDNNV